MFEIAVATRLLAPIVRDLYQGSKDLAEDAFKKWKASSFPQKLAKKIGATDKVKTIWTPDKDTSLTSFYYPSRVDISAKKKKEIKSVADLSTENVVIQGIVGQGKSIFLRYLCLQELAGTGSGRIPVFIELRILIPGKSFKYYLYQALEKLDLVVTENLFDYLANSGKIVLMLDGFDELDNKLIKETINELEFLIEKYDRLQIIITSRPDNEIQKSRLFHVRNISSLRESDYQGFLGKLGLSPERTGEIIRAIKESPSNVSELINTPLMLTLLVMVYETEKQIPSELPEFFERLFQVVFSRHDRLKAGFTREHYSGLSERRLQELFAAFCFMVLQNKFARSLTREQFEDAFIQAQDYTSNCKCDSENFHKDITKVACLMLEEGIGITTFLHKSILEYHAAAFIKHATNDTAELFYTAVREDYEQWAPVLSFLKQIDPYRHARYFVVPSYKRMLELLGAAATGTTKESLIKCCKTLHPFTGISYGSVSSDPNTYTHFSVGPFSRETEPIGDLHHSFQSALIQGMSEDAPQSVTRLEIMENPHTFIYEVNSSNEFHLSAQTIIKEYGGSAIFKNLNKFESTIRAILREAEKLIAQEDKKKLIFEKRT